MLKSASEEKYVCIKRNGLLLFETTFSELLTPFRADIELHTYMGLGVFGHLPAPVKARFG
jgi:hypothetical protein